MNCDTDLYFTNYQIGVNAFYATDHKDDDHVLASDMLADDDYVYNIFLTCMQFSIVMQN